MARIQHIAPTPVEKTELAKAQALEWHFGETQWANADAFTGDDVEYPEPENDERVFYTIALKKGRKRNIDACVDVLAVTRDLEFAIEMRLPATINDETLAMELVNHDGIPPAFTDEPSEDSRIPEESKERYGEVLERAHEIEVDNGGGD